MIGLTPACCGLAAFAADARRQAIEPQPTHWNRGTQIFPLWATFKGSTQQTWAGLTYDIHGAFYLAIASIAMGVAVFVTSGVAWPPPGFAWVFLVGAACFLVRGIHLLRVRSRLGKPRT